MPTVYNKVTFNAATLLSLENDTITAADLKQGVTAHDATGNAITGTLVPGGAAPNVYQDEEGFVVLDDEGGGAPSTEGLEYETGTVTISTQLSTYYDIPLSGTHSTPPTFFSVVAASNSTHVSTTLAQTYSYTGVLGWHPQDGNYNTTYGLVVRVYANAREVSTTGAFNVTTPVSDASSSATNCARYWASENHIRLYGTSTGTLQGPYEWIAIWR